MRLLVRPASRFVRCLIQRDPLPIGRPCLMKPSRACWAHGPGEMQIAKRDHLMLASINEFLRSRVPAEKLRTLGFRLLIASLFASALVIIFVPSGLTEKVLSAICTFAIILGIWLEKIADPHLAGSRRLSAKQRAEISSSLTGAPSALVLSFADSLVLSFAQGDAEARLFAEDIRATLVAAGITPNLSAVSSSEVMPGLKVHPASENDPTAKIILSAFRKAGLEIELAARAPFLILEVGGKPQSALARLEKKITPRGINDEQAEKLIEKVKEFAGTPFVVEADPAAEYAFVTRLIEVVGQAGWKWVKYPAALTTRPIGGSAVSDESGVQVRFNGAHGDKLRDPAFALAVALTNAFGVSVSHAIDHENSLSPSPEAIHVEIRRNP